MITLSKERLQTLRHEKQQSIHCVINLDATLSSKVCFYEMHCYFELIKLSLLKKTILILIFKCIFFI